VEVFGGKQITGITEIQNTGIIRGTRGRIMRRGVWDG
jgi:hypothetical protein